MVLIQDRCKIEVFLRVNIPIYTGILHVKKNLGTFQGSVSPKPPRNFKITHLIRPFVWSLNSGSWTATVYFCEELLQVPKCQELSSLPYVINGPWSRWMVSIGWAQTWLALLRLSLSAWLYLTLSWTLHHACIAERCPIWEALPDVVLTSRYDNTLYSAEFYLNIPFHPSHTFWVAMALRRPN